MLTFGEDFNVNSDYPCPLFNCFYCFTSSKELGQHLRFHAGLLPFMCHQCGLAYGRSHGLENHRAKKHQIVNDIKLQDLRGFFKCNICEAFIPFKEKIQHAEIHCPLPYHAEDSEED